jgi:hypothetical protein
MIVLAKNVIMIIKKYIIYLNLKVNMMMKMMWDKLTVNQKNKLSNETMMIIKIFPV